jgi:hypothetical protein
MALGKGQNPEQKRRAGLQGPSSPVSLGTLLYVKGGPTVGPGGPQIRSSSMLHTQCRLRKAWKTSRQPVTVPATQGSRKQSSKPAAPLVVAHQWLPAGLVGDLSEP